MIVILTEEFDIPTNNVVKKLDEKGAKYRLIYGSDFLNDNIQIDISNENVIINGEVLKNINIVWFRRWLISNYRFSEDFESNIYLKNEFDEYSSNFMNFLPTKKWLNNPPYINPYPTKSKQLKIAKKCGLIIPLTIITNSKKHLDDFYNRNDRNVITKNLSNPLVFRKENTLFATYTSTVLDEDIRDLKGDIFFPSIFQENIIKEIEIRTFYINGLFFSYAIFSSLNKQTETDFRIYDHKKPNRIMKYELPESIMTKVHKLMKNLKLHSGSIDFIKRIDGKYVFLEVNPQGQFGGLEDYGLDIENYIANYLIENDKF